MYKRCPSIHLIHPVPPTSPTSPSHPVHLSPLPIVLPYMMHIQASRFSLSTPAFPSSFLLPCHTVTVIFLFHSFFLSLLHEIDRESHSSRDKEKKGCGQMLFRDGGRALNTEEQVGRREELLFMPTWCERECSGTTYHAPVTALPPCPPFLSSSSTVHLLTFQPIPSLPSHSSSQRHCFVFFFGCYTSRHAW